MPVYHFTLHAYRSWSPAHPRGYVQHEAIFKSDPNMALHYDASARFQPIWFTRDVQAILILGTLDVCQRRNWRLHAIATDPTHFHSVISWKQYHAWLEVQRVIKNVLSLMLGRTMGQPGRPWFVRRGSRRRVLRRDHLAHLLNKYLPSHRGLCWREGEALPEDRWGLLGSKG